MSWPQFLLAIFMIAICVILIGVVLVQRGRGQGLAGAFGGGGGGGAFGAKTGDVFTWITIVIAVLFLLVNVAGNFVLDQTPAAPGVASATEPISVDIQPTEAPADGDGAPSITLKGTSTDTGQPIEVNVGETTPVAPVTPPADTGTDVPSGTDEPGADEPGGDEPGTDEPGGGNDDEE